MSYKPGELAPKDGRVYCLQHPEIVKKVEEGKKLPPCDNWPPDDPRSKGCVWLYK